MQLSRLVLVGAVFLVSSQWTIAQQREDPLSTFITERGLASAPASGRATSPGAVEAAPSIPPVTGPAYVELGRFSTYEAAQLAQREAERKLETLEIFQQSINGKRSYSLKKGPFDSVDAAGRESRRLEIVGFIPVPKVVSLGRAEILAAPPGLDPVQSPSYPSRVGRAGDERLRSLADAQTEAERLLMRIGIHQSAVEAGCTALRTSASMTKGFSMAANVGRMLTGQPVDLSAFEKAVQDHYICVRNGVEPIHALLMELARNPGACKALHDAVDVSFRRWSDDVFDFTRAMQAKTLQEDRGIRVYRLCPMR